MIGLPRYSVRVVPEMEEGVVRESISRRSIISGAAAPGFGTRQASGTGSSRISESLIAARFSDTPS